MNEAFASRGIQRDAYLLGARHIQGDKYNDGRQYINCASLLQSAFNLHDGLTVADDL